LNWSLRWGGVVVCVVVAGVWVATVWWTIHCILRSRLLLSFEGGTVAYQYSPSGPGSVVLRKLPSLSVERRDATLDPWAWGFRRDAAVTLITGGTPSYPVTPLWLPLLLACAPTAFAWQLELRRRRRSRIGHCPTCNYNLAGLASGAACPECGT
jgi:hypothetical protein